MRPDFQCGICQQVVPEMYYGGCCSICARIRCDQCMRECPVCGAQLCPECLGAPRAEAVCSHSPLPPRTPVGPGPQASRWQPPAAAPSPVVSSPPAPSTPRPAQSWLPFLLAALLLLPLYALLQFAVGDLMPALALWLAAMLGSKELPPALAQAALPVAWIVACAIVGARADSRLPLLLPVAGLMLGLLLQSWVGLNQLPGGGALPLAAAYAGLCLGGGFGGAWSAGWAWRRALAGGIFGLAPLALVDSRIADIAGVADAGVHLLLLVLLPLLLRTARSAPGARR